MAGWRQLDDFEEVGHQTQTIGPKR
jgi:hypothetical protein